ncbi:Uncharacterized protein FWK35_00002910, partial [Aphis craccivora]
MSKQTNFFGDGTYGFAPIFFLQLYTLHTYIRIVLNRVLPLLERLSVKRIFTNSKILTQNNHLLQSNIIHIQLLA